MGNPFINLTEAASDPGQLPMLQLMAQALGHTMQGIILTDVNGTILYVNPGFTQTTGYEPADVIGRKPSILQSGRHEDDFYKNMWTSLERCGQWQGEIWNRRKNGELYVEWMNISAIRDANGQATHYCAVFTDITERKQEEFRLKAENRKLEQLSLIDPLTGVANRRAFDTIIGKEWNRATRSGKPVSLLFIDIDYFKLYNDLYGHQQGDDALRQAASAMSRTLLRAEDLLARYGGEEFAVILPDTDIEGAVVLAQALRESIASIKLPHKGSAISPYLSISVGCACMLPAAGGTYGELVQAADKALYAAKEKGRNRVQIRA